VEPRPDDRSESRAARLAHRRRRSKITATLSAVAAVVALGGLAVTFSPGDDDPGLRAGGTAAGVTATTPEGAGAGPAGSDGSGGAPGEATATFAVPADTAPPTTRDPRRGSGEPVVFAFGGDTHFESYLRTQLDADPQGMLAPIAPVLSLADVAVVNFESAITERGEPFPKEYTFRAPAHALTALASAGVDAVSLANNHGLDFGPVGIEDARAASEATGIPIIGIGANADEAYAPYRTEVRGQRIAVIAATQVLDSATIASWTATDAQGGLASAKEVDRLVAEVERARQDSDTVVVFLHWGVSEATCPSGDQQALAERLADAGADIVVGGHAHRLQGAGFLGRTFVGYGLGNFIWYARPGASSQTGVLLVTAVGRDVEAYQWVPAVIQNGVPRPLSGDAAASAVAEWDALRGCTGLTSGPGD
jgi:hypothetical protein